LNFFLESLVEEMSKDICTDKYWSTKTNYKIQENLAKPNSYSPTQICDILKNKQVQDLAASKNLTSDLQKLIGMCSYYCVTGITPAKKTVSKAEITSAWRTLAGQLKIKDKPIALPAMSQSAKNAAAAKAQANANAAAAKAQANANRIAREAMAAAAKLQPAAPNTSMNSIMNSIKAIERNLGELKSRVTTWKNSKAAAAGGRRRTRKSRSRF